MSLCLLCSARSSSAQSGAVTLAWDPSPEASVVGYVVYVAHDGAEERFDVGRALRFPYQAALGGSGYTFSVVAYTETGLMSPRSEPVFYLAGSNSSAAAPPAVSPQVPDTGRAEPYGLSMWRLAAVAGRGTGSFLCDEGGGGCYRLVPIVASASEVTDLVPLPDGRLGLVLDSRRVVLVDTNQVQLALDLTSGDDTIATVIADSAFQVNHFVYLDIRTPESADLARVRIVRARELGGTFGEMASLVMQSVPIRARVPVASASDSALLVAAGSEVIRYDSRGVQSPTHVVTRAQSPTTSLVSSLTVDPTTGDVWTSAADTVAMWNGRLGTLTIDRESNRLVQTEGLAQGEPRVARYALPAGFRALVIRAEPEHSAVLAMQGEDGGVVVVRLIPSSQMVTP